jgi:hypothetical protein
VNGKTIRRNVGGVLGVTKGKTREKNRRPKEPHVTIDSNTRCGKYFFV